MTVLGAMLRSGNPENPSMPITGGWLSELADGGPMVAGVTVNERTVYGLSAWFRGVRIIAGTIAALPLHTYRRGTRSRTSGWSIDDPQPGVVTPFEWRQTMIANAITWGNAYAVKASNEMGVVRSLTPIHPSQVTVEIGPPTPENPSGKTFSVGSERTKYTPASMLEMPYLSLDGRLGIRPLQLLRESLGIGIAADRTASSFYANHGQPSGVLQVKGTLDEESANRLKARWRSKFAGPANRGDIAVLDNDASFASVSLPPEDAQLLESRQFSLGDVGRILGIPPHMLGDMDKSTSWGSGLESQMMGFVTFTLLPWLRLLEQRMTRELLPGGWGDQTRYAEFQVEGLLRADSKSRAEFYRAGIQNGWLNRNEARSKENLEPVDGLDAFLVPSNLAVLDEDGTYTPLSANGVNKPLNEPGDTTDPFKEEPNDTNS